MRNLFKILFFLFFNLFSTFASQDDLKETSGSSTTKSKVPAPITERELEGLRGQFRRQVEKTGQPSKEVCQNIWAYILGPLID